MSTLTQWLLALLAVVGAFFLAGLAGSVVADALGFWHIPGAGFCAALAVVLVAYVAAPSFRFTLSCSAFAAGAVLAWVVLEPSWYPDMQHYAAVAYQPTHLPVLATYTGGIIGLTLTGLFKWRPGA